MKKFRLHVWGDFACFTRPEMKVERVSYEVITPSAARAIFEAILWKPEIRWNIEQVSVLNPVKWINLRRNEVKKKASIGIKEIYIEDERVQRAGLFLRDTAYILQGSLSLSEKGIATNDLRKYEEMFERRASQGQCIIQPYLGCREFSAHFRLMQEGDKEPEALKDYSRDLGWMLYDMDYSKKKIQPQFFNAHVNQGVLTVPPFNSEEIRQ